MIAFSNPSPIFPACGRELQPPHPMYSAEKAAEEAPVSFLRTQTSVRGLAETLDRSEPARWARAFWPQTPSSEGKELIQCRFLTPECTGMVLLGGSRGKSESRRSGFAQWVRWQRRVITSVQRSQLSAHSLLILECLIILLLGFSSL